MKKIWSNLDSFIDTKLVISSLLAALLLFVATKSFAADSKNTSMINGAGATFPEPLYTKWFNEYRKVDSSTAINYQGIGSGGGIRQLISKTVDFGASDSPMNAEEKKSAGQPVLHIPTVLGAVVVSYNLKLEKPLKLDGLTVADIFSGKIKKWNDAKIQALNAGVSLPNTEIIVATRSDGSGTTAVFTDYLEKISEDWKGKASKTVDWFKGSVAAKGNAGVAGLIKQNEGTIGYIELIYALENKLAFAHIKNKAGTFVEASAKSVSAAAAKATPDMEKNDFQMSITNADGKDSYPISTFTWFLFYQEMAKDKGATLIKLTKWALGDQGQKMAQDMNYAPLPKELRAKILSRLNQVKLK
jgi:phosphate transport system substrate-binding protein